MKMIDYRYGYYNVGFQGCWTRFLCQFHPKMKIVVTPTGGLMKILKNYKVLSEVVYECEQSEKHTFQMMVSLDCGIFGLGEGEGKS